eukprot:591578-Pyramimonas_sp.AAC.1
MPITARPLKNNVLNRLSRVGVCPNIKVAQFRHNFKKHIVSESIALKPQHKCKNILYAIRKKTLKTATREHGTSGLGKKLRNYG